MKKMKNNSVIKKAFTMLEMSVVILIVGFLILAITQSSSVINSMRMQMARSLTQNSPVNSIPDLMMWLEPSLQESFLPAVVQDPTMCYYNFSLSINDTIEDTYAINNWYDINPQSVIKNHVVVPSGNCNMHYKRFGINNLPAVYFWAYDNIMVSANLLVPKNNQFTYFLVAQTTDPSSANNNGAFYNGDIDSNGFGYFKSGSPAGQRGAIFGGVGNNYNTTFLATAKPEITTVTCCNTAVTMSVNGTSLAITSAATSYILPTGSFRLGGVRTWGTLDLWQGTISEFIFFERVLTSSEINLVHQYLSKKYNIKVS